MQAFGLSLGSALCLLIPPPLSRRHRRLGGRVGVELLMPMLLVRDGDSGASSVLDQGSDSCHEVVHRSDPLLDDPSI
ncbi:unnamed protein product [Camellia sinensis]